MRVTKLVRLISALLCAATVAMAQIRLLSPSPDQVLYPNRVVRIEWEREQQLPIDVLYSTDNGNRWETIATALAADGIEWRVPFLDTVEVLVRAQLTAISAPRSIGTIRLTDSIVSAWWLGETKTVVSMVRSGVVNHSDVVSGEAPGHRIGGLEQIVGMSRYPSQSDSAIVAESYRLAVVSVGSGQVGDTFGTVPNAQIVALAAHPTLPIVAVGYTDGYVRLWNIVERRLVGQVLSQALGSVHAVAFDPGGTLLAHGGADGVIIVEPWKELGSSTDRIYLLASSSTPTTAAGVVALEFSPTGKYLASASRDSVVRVWDYLNWRAEHVFAKLEGIARALAFSRDGSRLLAGDDAGQLYHWSVATGEAVCAPVSVGDAIVAIGAHPLVDTLFVATIGGTLSLWTVERTPIASDSVRAVVRYPFGLQLGRVRGAIGDTVQLPILLDRQYRVPLFERSVFAARCRIVLPPSVAVVGQRSQYADHPRRTLWDTIAITLSCGPSDTVGVVPLQVLSSPSLNDQIRILATDGIEWERSVSAFVLERVEDGEVVIDTLCRVQRQRVPTFTEDIEGYAMPNPASDDVTIVFSAIEAGMYRIVLESLARGESTVLFEERFERGLHRLPLSVAAFSVGAYRIVIAGPSQQRTVSLLIVR